jgi:hypothetical protein
VTASQTCITEVPCSTFATTSVCRIEVFLGFPHSNYTRAFYVTRYWNVRARTYVLKLLCFPRILAIMINFSELRRLVAVLSLQKPGFDLWPPCVICGEPSGAETGFSLRISAFLL